MQYLLIRNARLADHEPDAPLVTILVADGRIVGIGKDLRHQITDTTNIDAQGAYVIPALINLNSPRPNAIDDDMINGLNFDMITSGVLTIMTVSDDIEDNIVEMENMHVPVLNYAMHFPLNQVVQGDARRLRRIMLLNGVATAIARIGDDRHFSIQSLAPHLVAARQLGLRVLFDIRAQFDASERWNVLTALVSELQKDITNKAYIIGVETEDELELVQQLRGHCDIACHVCYDPFSPLVNKESNNHLRANTIANVLRHGRWCTYGLTYSASRAIKEQWPDVTPAIVGRNRMSILNALPCSEPLSVKELVEFTVTRPAQLLGLDPSIGNVREGTLANFMLWRNETTDNTSIETPYNGAFSHLALKGKVEHVIMNGRIVMDEKLRDNEICGRHIYARLV